MKKKAQAPLLLALILLGGCVTRPVALDYLPPKEAEKTSQLQPLIMAANFTDTRKHEPNWLGAIRGGYGNPLKTLETTKPVKDVVRDVFLGGLRARGLLTEESGARYILSVIVNQFDCNQYVRREAHIKLQVILTNRGDNKEIFSKLYQTDNVGGSIVSLKVGFFASVGELRALAEKTLNQAVNEVLDDPAFLSTVGSG